MVHNGIIENYLSLRKELEAEGIRFSSDTDTEVLHHLLPDDWPSRHSRRGWGHFDHLVASADTTWSFQP